MCLCKFKCKALNRRVICKRSISGMLVWPEYGQLGLSVKEPSERVLLLLDKACASEVRILNRWAARHNRLLGHIACVQHFTNRPCHCHLICSSKKRHFELEFRAYFTSNRVWLVRLSCGCETKKIVNFKVYTFPLFWSWIDLSIKASFFNETAPRRIPANTELHKQLSWKLVFSLEIF